MNVFQSIKTYYSNPSVFPKNLLWHFLASTSIRWNRNICVKSCSAGSSGYYTVYTCILCSTRSGCASLLGGVTTPYFSALVFKLNSFECFSPLLLKTSLSNPSWNRPLFFQSLFWECGILHCQKTNRPHTTWDCVLWLQVTSMYCSSSQTPFGKKTSTSQIVLKPSSLLRTQVSAYKAVERWLLCSFYCCLSTCYL